MIGPNFTHGYSGYTNYRCRCEVCKRANAEYCARRKAERGDEIARRMDISHGDYSTYINWKCRCRECKDAAAARERRRRRELKVAR